MAKWNWDKKQHEHHANGNGDGITSPPTVPDFNPSEYLPDRDFDSPIPPTKFTSHTGYNRRGHMLESSTGNAKILIKNNSALPTSEDILREVALLENFIAGIDNKQFLVSLQSKAAPDESKWSKLAAYLSSGNYTSRTFAALCTRCGISWKEVINYFFDFQRSMGLYELMNHIPTSIKQAAEDSLRKSIYCRECWGDGEVWRPKIDDNGDVMVDSETNKVMKEKVKCLGCDGTGKIEKDADNKAREMTFKIAGLLKNDGPVINNNIAVGIGLEDTVCDISRILESAGAIDVDSRDVSDASDASEVKGE